MRLPTHHALPLFRPARGGGGFQGQPIRRGKLRVSDWPRNVPHEIQGLPRDSPPAGIQSISGGGGWNICTGPRALRPHSHAADDYCDRSGRRNLGSPANFGQPRPLHCPGQPHGDALRLSSPHPLPRTRSPTPARSPPHPCLPPPCPLLPLPLPCSSRLSSPAADTTPRRNSELLHVCTRGSQHKAQKEIWLVSGLHDHRYLSVNSETRRCQWVGH